MSKLTLGGAAVLAAAISPLHAEPAVPDGPGRPNVVLVITDDQGYGDLSCHGNPVLQTPELDRLHAESARLTNYHVSPTCAPTRGALMSGHYSNRSGAWHTILGRSILFTGESTLGELFRDGGYQTGLFGKWHLGDNYPYRPEDRGFTEVVRHAAGGEGQTPDFWDNAYFDSTYWHNGVPARYEGYCTDVFFNEARRFMQASVAAGQPFFAYISTNAPHSPFHCPEPYWKPYLEAGLSRQEAVFFGMIANIDENVGRLRGWLQEAGIARNTIFIFTTDNGTATGEGVFNAGMRGKKSSPYEGGHRVPMFIHWPDGRLDSGRDIGQLTAHIDLFPTLADLCGLALPASYPLDGRSLAPLLYDLPTRWPARVLVTDSQRVLNPEKWRQSSVMSDRWRLINGTELYDLASDPGQDRDVAAEFPGVTAALRQAYEAWWTDLNGSLRRIARIPLGLPQANPVLLTSHDWFVEGPTAAAWNQAMIRDADAAGTTRGRWAVNVESAGTYAIRLFRWPPELDHPLAAALPAGAPVPGLKAFRQTPGAAVELARARIAIDDQVIELPVDPARSSVDFEVALAYCSPCMLEASFMTAGGRELGAFYCLVEKIR